MSISEYAFRFKRYDALALGGSALLLSAVIGPAITGSRQFAAATDCKNNLRTLAQAMIVYAGENNDNLPACYKIPETGAPTDINASKSLGILYKTQNIPSRVFRCMSDPLAQIALFDATAGLDNAPNPCLATSYGYDPRHRVMDPGSVAILSDSYDQTGKWFNHGTPEDHVWYVAYLDTHVEAAKTPFVGYQKTRGGRDNIFTDDSESITTQGDSCIRGGVLSAGAGLSAEKREAMRVAARETTRESDVRDAEKDKGRGEAPLATSTAASKDSSGQWVAIAVFLGLLAVGGVVMALVLARKAARARAGNAGK
jgi:hypothetical protein